MDQVTSHPELTGFFRSFGVDRPVELTRLCAFVHSRQRADESALACAERLVGEWFRRQVDDQNDLGPALLHRARAAMLLSGLGRSAPEHFLADTVPASWVRSLNRALPRPTPQEQWGHMPTQSLSPAPAFEAVRRFVLPFDSEVAQ